MTVQLSEAELNLVKSTLLAHVPHAKFYLFGSRVKGTAKKYSDLDVLIISDKPLPLTVFSALRETFDESTLVFKVDMVDWHRITPEFREKIKTEWVEI